MGVDPLRIDHQAAAGHIHLYAVAGDFALQMSSTVTTDPVASCRQA